MTSFIIDSKYRFLNVVSSNVLILVLAFADSFYLKTALVTPIQSFCGPVWQWTIEQVNRIVKSICLISNLIMYIWLTLLRIKINFKLFEKPAYANDEKLEVTKARSSAWLFSQWLFWGIFVQIVSETNLNFKYQRVKKSEKNPP